MSAPSERVIRAFGVSGVPQPLAGGRGTAWRVGTRVLKPADMSIEEIKWQAQVLSTVRPQGLRLVVPLQSTEGAYVVDGWIATPYVQAVHQPGRWQETLEVGRRLTAALGHLPRPPFLDARRSLWDRADRVAWGEESIGELAGYAHIADLAGLRCDIDAPPQLIHGDLTGNVLFAPDLAPAVIDITAYWRPATYGNAIVVADALVWEGAEDSLVAALDGGSYAGQFIVRALLFRAIAEVLRQPEIPSEVATSPFSRAIVLARSLVANPGVAPPRP